MTIPVLINNRDLYPEKIVAQCLALDDAEVYLIDNGSTYPATVEYLSNHPHGLNMLGRDNTPYGFPCMIPEDCVNGGPRAACWFVHRMRPVWHARGIRYYATTDSDLDLSGIPADALRVFAGWLQYAPGAVKVGCALRLDDLPDTPQAAAARHAEAKHWEKLHPVQQFHTEVDSARHDVYCADIDTTLAVYRLNPPWDGSYGPSLRIAGDYQARHLPWYHTDDNRPNDYRWYLDHADPTGTVYTAAEIHKRALG